VSELSKAMERQGLDMKVTALVSNYKFYSNLHSIFVLKTLSVSSYGKFVTLSLFQIFFMLT